MKKTKYEKPHATDLSAVQPVAGTCASGSPEYKVNSSCGSGDTAFAPCTAAGGVVIENFTTCSTGGSAVFSCWHNGNLAG